jgi:hypothetical protein
MPRAGWLFVYALEFEGVARSKKPFQSSLTSKGNRTTS